MYRPLLVATLIALAFVTVAHADLEFNMGSSLSSTNFRILDPQHAGFGGGASGSWSNSASFRMLSTVGDLGIGLSSSSFFGLRSGFEYFPFIQEPVLTSATPGNEKVTLNWTAAQAGAGLTVGSYNVCTKPPSGSFTCQNVGLVLNFVKTGLTNGTTYTFKIQANDALGNLIAESNQRTAKPTGGGGGGGGGSIPTPTPTPTPGGGASVILTGLAYPAAFVHILRDGTEIGTTFADSHGVFEIDRGGLSPGVANLGFWAVDTDGRRSVTWVFAVTLVDGNPNRVGGIIVPPTISLSATEVPVGQPVTVRGQSAPGATVRIDFSGRQSTVIAGPVGDGRYSTILSTVGLPAAVYEVKSRTELPSGDKSTWSQLIRLGVGVPLPATTCPRDPDINRDGSINLVDFSILAFWWQKTAAPGAPYDLNCDGRVTLADFSIEAFYWTGR